MKRKLAALLTAALLAAGCAASPAAGDPGTDSGESSGSAAVQPVAASVSEEDLDGSWDTASATLIKLGATPVVSGPGAAADGKTVTVSSPGTYLVQGSAADAQIVVKASSKDTVRLVLAGVSLTNKTGAAIYAPKCAKLIITLADGTENTLTDGGSSFIYADAEKEEPNATLFCKDSMTINGTGSLTVTAGFNNGLTAKDNLIIASGAISVTAVNNAVRGNDSVTVLGARLTVSAGNDAVKTSATDGEHAGTVEVRGGEISVDSAHDAIQSAGGILISGGTFVIRTGSSSPAKAVPDSDSTSFKGVKSAGVMSISGGTFTLDCQDDGFHSESDILITGGDFTVASGDDGMHADKSLRIEGGSIRITKCYEGLESESVTVTGGVITIFSKDDGINAAAGGTGSAGGGARRSPGQSAGSSVGVTITGGTVTVYSTSDVIDANGYLTVTGGTLALFVGTTRDGDATDVDGTAVIPWALYGKTAIPAGTVLSVGNLWSLTMESNATGWCLIIPGVGEGSWTLEADGSPLVSIVATKAVQGMMGGPGGGGTGGAPAGPGAPGGRKGGGR